jgi:anti-sigma B factor antagonist
VEPRKAGNGLLLRVRGQVDMSTSPRLRGALKRAVEDAVTPVVVSLAGVTYMDSSGVATLVECLRGVGRYGGALVLCHLNEALRNVFAMSRLETVFDIRDTEEDALS